MLIDLPNYFIFILDFIAWFFFHMGISALTLKIPDNYFKRHKELFSSFSWENSGQFWSKWFHVRKWKDSLPDSSSIFKTAYNKKVLHPIDSDALEKFILETQRAELAHWLSILPAPLFFIWNPAWAGCLMIIYAFLFNLPFIIIQRYNRPRLIFLLNKKRQRNKL